MIYFLELLEETPARIVVKQQKILDELEAAEKQAAENKKRALDKLEISKQRADILNKKKKLKPAKSTPTAEDLAFLRDASVIAQLNDDDNENSALIKSNESVGDSSVKTLPPQSTEMNAESVEENHAKSPVKVPEDATE